MEYYGNYSGFENYGYQQNNKDINYNYNKNNYNASNYNNKINNNNFDNTSKNLKIEEAILKSSYPKYTRDFVKNFIIKNYYNRENTKVFLTLNDEEKLFVIEYNLPVNFNNRIYNVFILVYLPTLYPNYEPEFYIEKKGNIGIYKYYQNGKINSSTLKINLQSFVCFSAEKNNIEEIIDKLKEEFNIEFPVYKNEDQSREIFGKCVLNKKLVSQIIIDNNIKNNDIDKYKNKEFDDKSFLDFMRNQVKDILREKYMDFNDKFQIKDNYKDLKTINNRAKNNYEKISLSNDINIMEKEMNYLKNIKQQYMIIENNLYKENQKLLTDKNIKSIFEKCDDIIKIKDEKELEYIIMKKTIEDYLIYLKKGYEKKIVSLEDMINETRKLSREIFNIAYLTNKIRYFRNKYNY